MLYWDISITNNDMPTKNFAITRTYDGSNPEEEIKNPNLPMRKLVFLKTSVSKFIEVPYKLCKKFTNWQWGKPIERKENSKKN